MKKLRSGYTTGACAAAAAKAATSLLLSGRKKDHVSIPFPDGSRVTFKLVWSDLAQESARAAVKKDAGDDPDITNGALIVAKSKTFTLAGDSGEDEGIRITGGQGVGVVTKPGLSVAVGQPAINPVPMRMIREAVAEVLRESGIYQKTGVAVCIIVPEGEELAKKTLNKRLGIRGGISILGTTGIVRPISAGAWTATISSSMDVASAAGVSEIILSTGRSSERCVENILFPPEEALVMMGDYLEYALKEAGKHAFTRIHMAAMWAKLLKGAMGTPQTHVRHGVLDIGSSLLFLSDHGVEDHIIEELKGSNTAREVLERLLAEDNYPVIDLVCDLAKSHYEAIAGIPVTVHLVHGSGKLICSR